MNAAQIKHMVDRFLGWKLPNNFNPDGGVSFTKYANQGTPYQHEYQPSGTNLLDATQADAMVRHMVEDMPVDRGNFRWLIEAPGPRYLAVETLSHSNNFKWTADHNAAMAFRTKEQADAAMMAIRQMSRALSDGLFDFEVPLGNAQPVEHGWMDATDSASRFGRRLGGMLSESANRINDARD